MKKGFLISLLIFTINCKKDNDILEDILDPSIDLIDSGNSQLKKIIPCIDGLAGQYECNGYDLIGHLSLSELETEMANDSWGWTDSKTGKEYALVGTYEGTAFIDISEPVNPLYLGKLVSATEPSTWRDIKVFNDYAFIVSEAKDHGLQIFDLKKLREIKVSTTFESDLVYNEFGAAHNIFINEKTGYAYILGNRDMYKGGPIFINISDPLNPILEGGYESKEYVHDAQIVIYDGPDEDYKGKEIYVGSHGSQSSENLVVILDVTNKNDPKFISEITYSDAGYAHQGFFSENQRYFFLGDELDEVNFGTKTRTFIFDFTDLNNPFLSFINSGPTKAIDHNGYIKNNLFYLANYSAGVRIFDISKIENKSMEEVGFFDTYNKNNSTEFNGVWNVFPFFDSNNIILSDLNSGLFIIKSNKL